MGFFWEIEQDQGNVPQVRLLYHATIDTVQSVDFVHSNCKMATSLPRMLKMIQYH